MAGGEYTPTTDEVREAVDEWVWSRRMFRSELASSDVAEFDRWLADHDREVAAKALTDAADEIEWIVNDAEVAETVAFPPGTVGLGVAIDRRDVLLEAPNDWLRARAAALGVPVGTEQEAENG